MTRASTARPRSPLAAQLALASLVGVLAGHALYFGFVTDDAYISFVYARNLAEYGEPVFNAGTNNPVEGYTNLSWVVLLALLSLVGVGPEVGSQALGIACAGGALVTTYALGQRVFPRDSLWPVVAPALLAMSSGFACWSSGGLETQLFVLLIALAFYACARGGDADRSAGRWLRRAGWLLGLAALTRPEGLLVAAVLGASRAVQSGVVERRLRPSRDELACVGWFAAVWVPVFLWRWHYYGFPLPNTYYVKAGDGGAAYRQQLLAAGWYYVGQWARQSGALYAAPFALAGAWVWRRGLGGPLLVLAVAYLGYAVSVGGDFMGLFRFVMPVFFCVAVLAAVGLRAAATQLSSLGEAGRAAAGALVLGILGAHAVSQARLTTEAMRPGNWRSDRGIDTPAFLHVYARDRALIGRHMAPCVREDDVAVFGGAGAKPYYGRMRGLDVFGLVSERIAHGVAPTRPRPGHNKWAPDALLAELEPTFVFSCYDLHRDPERPRWNCNPQFWFDRGYERVTLQIPGLVERGEFYSFLARRERAFSCQGLIRPARAQ